MRKEEFTFDSRDGVSKIHAVRWIPEGEIRCILQIVHGMAEYIERYEEAAEWFCERGIMVVGEDHLGHGKTVEGEGTYGYFTKMDPATVVVRDVHRLKKLTEEEYPSLPYVIWGHSMGSFILRNYLFKYGFGIDAAIVCGTGQNSKGLIKFAKCLAKLQGVFLGDKHIAKMLNTMAFGSSAKIPEGHKNDWLCTDHSVVEKYDDDPLCGFTFTVNGFKTLFELIDRLNKFSNVLRVPKTTPIFVISGSEDIVGNKGAGVKKVFEEYKKAGINDVTMKLYDGLRHEIHNEPSKYEVFEDMLNWIESRVINK
ncbi:MAG: lysophospholipase [Lachnospiraceae bacterium]|nr:lysophospholipase [Lachnospiraceae bacterium]